ncbi:MAG: amino acid adenylation domain-containing protein, partial [bacterium]|nr:amino acid adenylation domain-containing protein [bacterium]
MTPTVTFNAYEASSAQKRVFLVQCLDENSTVYNMPAAKIIEGPLDRGRLETAIKKLIQRHEALRTSFVMANERVVQKVYREIDFNLTTVSPTPASTPVDDLIHRFIRPFDIGEAPLWRTQLVRLEEGGHFFLFDIHHIISDGVSIAILFDEIAAFYRGRELTPLDFQYVDFTLWQNDILEQGKIEEQEQYWLHRFDGDIPLLELPTDYPRPSGMDTSGDTLNGDIPPQLARSLGQLAGRRNVTLFVVLLAAYTILLSKYTGQENICVGTPIAGRPQPELEKIVGMFVNTLVMKNKPETDKTIDAFLAAVANHTFDAFENQDYPFELLVENLEVERQLNRNPLFDTMFVMQNYSGYDGENPPGNRTGNHRYDLKFTDYPVNEKVARVDISMFVSGDRRGFTVNLEYRTSLFRRETMERFLDHFLRILCAAVETPASRIGDISMVTPPEKEYLLYTLNDTQMAFPRDRTLHRLFYRQSLKTPDRIAVAEPRSAASVTFRHLDETSAQVAAQLRLKGVEPGSIVGLMVERSLDMITAILGILRNECAYLPIDPDYPGERILFMLTDSGINVLLNKDRPGEEITAYRAKIVNFKLQTVELPLAAGRGRENTSAPKNPAHSAYHDQTPNVSTFSKPAYVIYTSGSTGKPKGVIVEHRQVVNFITGITHNIDFSPGRTIVALTTVSFDIFVLETLLPLTQGVGIAVANEVHQTDPSLLKHFLRRCRADMLQVTPSRLQLLSALDDQWESLSDIKDLMVGGETFPLSLFRTIRQSPHFNGSIHNLYGPTETTVWSTMKSFPPGKQPTTLTIGGPIANTRIYILDRQNNLQPVGIPGSLCIGGEGLARGYLNRIELTASQFDNDLKDWKDDHDLKKEKKGTSALSATATVTLYRTGDIARWRWDKDIEFMGREDHQVKIRGRRVELGEIESRLMEHENILEAVVIDHLGVEDGDRCLCAYITPTGEIPAAPRLREYLSHSLPGYMMPAFFVTLDEIPLTPNGKVDRDALPRPGRDAPGDAYAAPGNETEEKLAQLWAHVLGVETETIGVGANFFHLGGHSLKAAVLVTKIHRQLNVRLPLAQLFRSPTIRRLAEVILASETEDFIAVEPAETKEYYPLTPPQERLYVLQRLHPQSVAYHLPRVIPLEKDARIRGVEDAFRQLIRRHGSLRTSFPMVEHRPVQMVHPGVDFEVESREYGAGSIETFTRPFDLETAPLLRAAVVKTPDRQTLLLVDIHHIVTDAASMESLGRELTQLHRGNQPAPVELRYIDYTQWWFHKRQHRLIQRQEKYWLNRFQGELPLLDLPIDFPRPVIRSSRGNAVQFRLGENETTSLHRLAIKTGSTLYMVLFTSFSILLAKLGGQEDIIIGVPVAGRRHPGLQRVIGMFVNTLALRVFPQPGKTLEPFLTEVREDMLQAYDNQEYPFEELVNRVPVQRDTARNPVFDVMFNLLHFPHPPGPGREIIPDTSRQISGTRRTAIFDLNITASQVEENPQLFFDVEYSTELFKPDTIERITRYFKRILCALPAALDEDKQLAELETISGSEKHQILYQFNATAAHYPERRTLHQLFMERAKRTGDRVAVSCGPVSMAYRQLDKQTHRLAALLREKGILTGGIVAIIMERRVEMMVGILGILKAGAAYLPIDPGCPGERIDFMLRDSGAGALVMIGSRTPSFDTPPPAAGGVPLSRG